MLIKEATREIFDDITRWYFEIGKNEISDISKTSQKSPKYTNEIWATLFIEAISSFNQGLEGIVNSDNKRANFENASLLVGEDAFNVIAFLVAAQAARRPVDVWAQASTIYTNAMSQLADQQKLFEASKQLYDMSKTEGLDPHTAQSIAGLAADVQERASAATAYSGGGEIGGGGLSQAGMPTGVTIQGKKVAIGPGILKMFDVLYPRYDDLYASFQEFYNGLYEEDQERFMEEYDEKSIHPYDLDVDELLSGTRELIEALSIEDFEDADDMYSTIAADNIDPLIALAELMERDPWSSDPNASKVGMKAKKLIADAQRTAQDMVDSYFEERPEEVLEYIAGLV